MSDGITFDDLARQAKNEADDEQTRESDLALLRALLDESDDIGDEHAEAFADMLERLERSPRSRTLTGSQREYAENVADRHDIAIPRRPAQNAANIPRGREVKTPDVLSKDALKAALNARKGAR